MPSPLVPDLAIPLRTVMLNTVSLASQLATYQGSPAIFTRRPAPVDAPYPMIVVSGNVSKRDQDGVDDSRPIITRDIAIYGTNEVADHYRAVENMSDIVYAIFHHDRTAIDLSTVPNLVSGWNVVDIHCRGPIMAPTDDDMFVGRVVSLDIFLANPAQ